VPAAVLIMPICARGMLSRSGGRPDRRACICAARVEGRSRGV